MNLIKELLKDAICNNDVSFLEKHKQEYSVNDRFDDEDHDTLLLYSLSDPNNNVYEFLLERNADTSLVNDMNENIVHAIVYSGVEERLDQFVKDENIDHRSSDGSTPLLLSIGLEKIGIANKLMDLGANIFISDNEGNLPIHLACSIGSLELVKKLISRNTTLTQKTKKGNLPFALAVNNGHDEVVKYLFDKIYFI